MPSEPITLPDRGKSSRPIMGDPHEQKEEEDEEDEIGEQVFFLSHISPLLLVIDRR